MAHSSRKPTRSGKLIRKSAKRKVIKKLSKKSHKRHRKKRSLFSILAIAVLFAGGVAAIACARIGFLLIVEPYEVRWVNQLLPEWAKFKDFNLDLTLSREQIEETIRHKGQIVGKILPLTIERNTDQSFLLPVLRKRPNCQSDCQEIVELRAYHRSDAPGLPPGKYYEMVAQLPIVGPEELFVIAPLVNITNETQGANIALPLNQIQPFKENTTQPGVWFYLQGQRNSGNHTVTYGHIIHYNPKRQHLQVMQSWTSPSGDKPKWLQVTGDDRKELVVNQTVGFEPRVRVYQVKPLNSIRNPIQLQAIDLKPPAFKNKAYQKALLIARSGLWTPAFKWLEFIKKQHQRKMPADSIAQTNLIRLHSELSTKQANINWASPSQQIQVYLIDGGWEKALQVFEKSPDDAKEIASLLKADNGRLWDRVKAALQVNPNRPQVQTWGALILATQFGESRARSWLKTQNRLNEDNLSRLETLLKRLKGETE